MRRLSLVMVVGSIALMVGACNSTPTGGGPEKAAAAGATTTPASPVVAADKEWTSPNKNPASTRYSSLNEINTGNVKNLKVAWTTHLADPATQFREVARVL